jgi:hypothetical protein
MRLGQSAGTVENLLSDPEERMALVPLTQGEYITSLQVAASLPLEDNIAGRMSRDEIQRSEILAVSCREIEDFTQRYYANGEAVRELEAHDLNHLFDSYMEMTHEQSPRADGMSEGDFSELKKALQTIQWSELSGPQWYAAQRFLNSIRNDLLMGNVPGSSQTLKSTTKNESDDITTDAGKNTSDQSAKDAESPSLT